ncbi:uncharacterized protein LOC127002817 isoform X2 [Eriocheir sinensis]|uniref:uncharacterized protein LOC127002817 isoform X2 n=1 Tax=Eriocheir sinensis TaxID=95602 RepID=UPI0021C6FBE5|nr:uncharacterized protein LOC127002817 isoform X2 [Eriocheir sinensis]
MLPVQARLIEEWVRTCNTDCLRRTLCQGNVDRFVWSDGTTSLHLAASLPREREAVAVARLLLYSGANPNVPNNEGRTSVHIAAQNGHTQLLKLLILQGGDPLLGDGQGRSAVDWVSLGHHQQALGFLNSLLDTADCSHYKGTDCDAKFKLTFIGYKVMGRASLCRAAEPDTSSSSSSCASKYQQGGDGGGGGDVSLGTRIVQYVRQHQDQDTDSNLEDLSCERPAFLSSHPFLQSLQRQVEACQADTDSENDMRALKRCLGGTLQQRDISSGDYEETGSESTIRELNVARLAISVSFDSSCDDGSHGEEGHRLGESEQRPLEGKSDNEDSVSDIIQPQGESGMGGTADLTAKTEFKPDFCTTPQLIGCPRKREAFIYRETKVPSGLKKKLIFNVSDSTLNLPETESAGEPEFTEYMHPQHQTCGESRRAPDCYPSDCNHTCDESSRIVKGVSSRNQTGTIFTKSGSSVRSPRKNGDLPGENPASLYQPTHCRKLTPYSPPESTENGDRYEKAKKNSDFPGEVGTAFLHQPTHCKKFTLCSAPKSNENGDSPEKPKKNGDLRSARGRKTHQIYPQTDLTPPQFSPHRENMHGDTPGELKKIVDFPGEFNKNNASSSARQTQALSSPSQLGCRYGDFYCKLKIDDFPIEFGKNDGSSSACQNQTQSSPLLSGNRYGDFYKNKIGDFFGSCGRSEPHQTPLHHSTPQSPGERITQHQSPNLLANSCPGVLSIAEEFLYEDLMTGARLIEIRCPSLLSLVSRGRAGGVSMKEGKKAVNQVFKTTKSEGTQDNSGKASLPTQAMSLDKLLGAMGGLDFNLKPEDSQDNSGKASLPTQTMSRDELRGAMGGLDLSPKIEYSPELQEALKILHTTPSDKWTALKAKWQALEETMRLEFTIGRDRARKQCFTYLLLDPRITWNLPAMGPKVEEWKKFERFLSAIFYVGKGTNDRPYQHLTEALEERQQASRIYATPGRELSTARQSSGKGPKNASWGRTFSTVPTKYCSRRGRGS